MISMPSIRKKLFRPFSTETTIQTVASSTAEFVSPAVAIQAIEKETKKAFEDFATMVGEIPSVEQVRGQKAGSYLHLVTYLSNSTEVERFTVYEAEKRLFVQYPRLCFEFDLIDRCGYPWEAAEIKGKYIKTIRELPDSPPEIQ